MFAYPELKTIKENNMQIQSINTNTPNFQANRLRTAVRLAKTANRPNTSIDIYSINSSDSELINKLLMKIDLKNRTDLFAVKEKNNVNDTIRNVLTKALNLTEKSSDGVYIAVKNGKHVTGLLDFTDSGIPLLKNLVVWRGNKKNDTRMNLFMQFLKGVGKKSKTNVVAYAEDKTKGGKWLLEQGFTIPPQNRFARQRFVMPKNEIKSNLDKFEKHIENNPETTISDKIQKDVTLTNLDL